MASTWSLNIPAVAPLLVYDPPRDEQGSYWQSDAGGMDSNEGIGSGTTTVTLQNGVGNMTIGGFLNAVSVFGSLSGDSCSYNATLLNRRDPNAQMPASQTSPQDSDVLVQFKDLDLHPYDLAFQARCQSGSSLKITGVEMTLWAGAEGGSVSNRTIDDADPSVSYTQDWVLTERLTAPFNNDTQHSTQQNGNMTLSFQGTAFTLYGSTDQMHGPYRVILSSDKTGDRWIANSFRGKTQFLGVPVPIYLATGLDPSATHQIILENMTEDNQYLDFDYAMVYSSTSNEGPPGGPDLGSAGPFPGDSGNGNNGGKNPPGTADNKGVIIGGVVGGVLGLLLVLFLLFLLYRRRKTKAKASTGPQDITGKIVTEQKLLGVSNRTSHRLVVTDDSPHTPPHARVPENLRPTPFGERLDAGFIAPTGPTHALPPSASHHLEPVTPVTARRQSKLAELEHARRLAAGESAGPTDRPDSTFLAPPIPASPLSHRSSTAATASSIGESSSSPGEESSASRDVKRPIDEPPPYETLR